MAGLREYCFIAKKGDIRPKVSRKKSKGDWNVNHSRVIRGSNNKIEMYAIMNPTKPQYSIEIWKGVDGMYYFHVVHINGKIICTSEGYTRKSRAILAAQKMSLNVANATFITNKQP